MSVDDMPSVVYDHIRKVRHDLVGYDNGYPMIRCDVNLKGPPVNWCTGGDGYDGCSRRYRHARLPICEGCHEDLRQQAQGR